MTHAQFARAADYTHDRHWLTGEEQFLHVPAVMRLDGWNFYGHSGNNQLTEPQRVLMMWSDLVGAVEAFDDWFYRDETREASKTFVGYIRRHRDDLCRLSD